MKKTQLLQAKLEAQLRANSELEKRLKNQQQKRRSPSNILSESLLISSSTPLQQKKKLKPSLNLKTPHKSLSYKSTPKTPVTPRLPNIDSDYSSELDPRALKERKQAIPPWARTPALAKSMIHQTDIRPDTIFGKVKKIDLKEIFSDQK